MTIKIIIHSLCLVIFGGYALLALYFLLHGAYIYSCDTWRTTETRTLIGESGFEAKGGEKDIFVYRHHEETSRRRSRQDATRQGT